jgi:hypothetical protein
MGCNRPPTISTASTNDEGSTSSRELAVQLRRFVFLGVLGFATTAFTVEPEFADVTEAAGIVGLGSILTESVAWGDYDGDGDPDLYLTNDGVNRLYRNDGSRFTDVTVAAGVGDDRFGVGTAFADYDRDGDVDLVITGAGGRTRLWRNDTPRENHWLGVRLVGAAPNTTAIGARVEVRAPGGVTVQEVSGGAGRGSQNDQALIFGLGDSERVESVAIRWPDGSERVVRPRGVDRWLTVFQSPPLRRSPRRVSGGN